MNVKHQRHMLNGVIESIGVQRNRETGGKQNHI